MTAPADLSVASRESTRRGRAGQFDDLIATGLAHRAARLDARRVPQDADPPDLAARALRDHRHAARVQLDHARAEPQAQGDPDGQGAGRGRPRALPLLGGADPRHLARGDDAAAHRRQGALLVDLQLHDPDLGRHGRDRLARRRRRDLQPGAAVPRVVRAVRPRDGAHLQGGVVPPAAGLRDPARAHAGHRPRSARWRRTP